MPPELCLSFCFAYPDDETLVGKYCNLVKGMLEKSLSLITENYHLAALRDFLLPLLMNGQVTVRDDAENTTA